MQSKLFQAPVSEVTPTQQNKHMIAVRSYFRKVPLIITFILILHPKGWTDSLGLLYWPVKCSEML